VSDVFEGIWTWTSVRYFCGVFLMGRKITPQSPGLDQNLTTTE